MRLAAAGFRLRTRDRLRLWPSRSRQCSASARPPDPADRLKDPGQEAHARMLFQPIRCLVCQNESIDDFRRPTSPRPASHRPRQIVRGSLDAQIAQFLTDRYGQFILLKPPAFPWECDAVAGARGLVLGGGAARRHARRARRRGAVDAAEESRLKVKAEAGARTAPFAGRVIPRNFAPARETKARRRRGFYVCERTGFRANGA